MKPKLAIVSLGCDKNRVNTEKMLSQISDLVTFSSSEDAEYVFINTCGFLESARQELFEILDSFRPEQKLILAGCFWKFADEGFYARFPNVISFLKDGDDIRKIVTDLAGARYIARPQKQLGNTIFLTPPSYAFLKVSEGCDNHCTFCIIPQLRGKYHSRKIEEILEDAKVYLERGVKELILVAQDVGNYGADLDLALVCLLREIEKLPVEWIRLLYLYPERISDELLSFIAKSKKVLPYFDMPLQHAADSVLRRMGRPYKKAEIVNLLGKIRAKLPEAVIRSTFIVGFPGETAADFEELKTFLKSQKLNHVGVFGYSDEELCSAYKLKDKVEQKTIQKREKEIMELQKKISAEHLAKFVGKEIRVLIDGNPEEGVYIGRNFYFAPEVDGALYFNSGLQPAAIGEIVKVQITEAGEYDLFGEISS
ncbi:MAG: 30S ribosomal protein S12 methylthiotransferase RimO [Candidatus Gracilibacteria bacterium]|nr:30S ribosomal protein S12 methylthiotransferase RimO [Candidatus Gracilibacteria bacterium]